MFLHIKRLPRLPPTSSRLRIPEIWPFSGFFGHFPFFPFIWPYSRPHPSPTPIPIQLMTVLIDSGSLCNLTFRQLFPAGMSFFRFTICIIFMLAISVTLVHAKLHLSLMGKTKISCFLNIQNRSII